MHKLHSKYVVELLEEDLNGIFWVNGTPLQQMVISLC